MSRDVGLQLERLFKRFKPYTEVRVIDNYGEVYAEDTVGNILNGKYENNSSYTGKVNEQGFLNRSQPYMRYQIKNITIDDDDVITIELDKDNLEIKHYSKYYYDDEFITLAKERWSKMLDRTTNGRQKCYEDVIVCDEWKDFSNYFEWFKDNWIDYDGRVDVDKDLIDKTSRIYSPKTCCIIPHEINIGIRIVNNSESKGIVNWDKRRQGYKIRIKVYTRHIDTHRKKYKDALDLYFEKKDEFVKAMAEDFKDVIDKRAYDALTKYNSRELYLEKFGDYPSEYYE